MSAKRVVVTGLGATSPVGGDVPTTWSALLEGRSGVGALTQDWAEQLGARIAAEVAVEPLEVLDRVKARRLDRSGQLALIAANEAWADAGLADADVDSERLAVAMASGIGGVQTLLSNYDALKEKGPRRVSPLAIPMLMPNSPAANIGLAHRRQGGRAHAGLGLRVRQRGDRPGHRHDPARAGPTLSCAVAPRPPSTRCRWLPSAR